MIRGMAGCADDIVEICKKYMEEKHNEQRGNFKA
jgi:hypothetical protein